MSAAVPNKSMNQLAFALLRPLVMLGVGPLKVSGVVSPDGVGSLRRDLGLEVDL
jgi:hypothetical protein